MDEQTMRLQPCNVSDSPFQSITWKATFIYQYCAITKLDCASSFTRELKSNPTAWFRERTCPFPFRGLKLRVPEPTASIGLNIVHSQLNHEGYQTSGIELRQLLDLAMIRARHESAIDWFELDHRFGAAGFGHACQAWARSQ